MGFLKDDIMIKGQLAANTQQLNNVSKPRLVLWDTDWCGDCDDAGAARILNWAEQSNMVDIIACVISSYYANAVPSLDAFMDFEGHPNMTIGIDHNAADITETPSFGQANMLSSRHTYVDSTSAEEAVTTYRRALATSTDKIDIVITGYMTIFSQLLKSPADVISPLTGLQLVFDNVNKIYVMGGDYPSGSEWNFIRGAKTRAAASYVCANCPVPIIFCGYSIGSTIITGNTLPSVSPATDDMLTKAYADHSSVAGRESWDPMTMLLAVIGNAENAGFSLTRGTNVVDATTGNNVFTANSTGFHYYVTKIRTDNYYKRRINTIFEKVSWQYRNNIGIRQLPKP